MTLSLPEILFPPHLIHHLANERGPLWQNLVSSTIKQSATSLEIAALILMIARLVNCNSCNANAQRLVLGCAECARTALSHYRGSDDDLVNLNKKTILELKQYTS